MSQVYRYLYRILLFVACYLETIKADRSGVCANCGRTIQRGESDEVNEYPMMADLRKLGNDYNIVCTATIVSITHVITSAHCAEEHDIYRFVVHVGRATTDIYYDIDVTQVYEVIKVTHHPQYKVNDRDYNIAILKLEKDIQFSSQVYPACLPSPKLKDYDLIGSKVTAMGWGYVYYLNTSPPPNEDPSFLKKDYLNVTDCNSMKNIDEIMHLCTIGEGKPGGGCRSFDGSPILWEDPKSNNDLIFIGMTNTARTFCAVHEPVDNTKIVAHLDWILREIKAEQLCTSDD